MNKLLEQLKNHWKYILAFLLGVILACVIPLTPAGRLLRKTSSYVDDKEKAIHELENNVNKLKGEVDYVSKLKASSDNSIKILTIRNDSLRFLLLKQDTIIKKLNKQEYEEINSIDDFNDQQLYDFFTKYKTR